MHVYINRILVDECASAYRWGAGVVTEHKEMSFRYGGWQLIACSLGASQVHLQLAHTSPSDPFGQQLTVIKSLRSLQLPF